MKFNINIEEVKAILAFMEETKHQTVSVEIGENTGIGSTIHVQKTCNRGEKKNITNYNCW